MTETAITYQKLFSVLESLGFARVPAATATNRHVFRHAPTDTILAFGRQQGELATPADMLSAEVHLHARGITEESLESLLNAIVAGKQELRRSANDMRRILAGVPAVLLLAGRGCVSTPGRDLQDFALAISQAMSHTMGRDEIAGYEANDHLARPLLEFGVRLSSGSAQLDHFLGSQSASFQSGLDGRTLPLGLAIPETEFVPVRHAEANSGDVTDAPWVVLTTL